jgi:glutamyl-tRNA synthetase
MVPEIKPARVRFAPSPTGRFHIGSARTALYDYLYARKTGGQFILRLEDTDQKRFDPQSESEFYESLRWLGLHWDEGPDIGGPHAPYRQSERVELYQEYADELVANGRAYHCFCTPERLTQVRQEQQKRKEPPRYDGLCRSLSEREVNARRDSGESTVIRFKTPREGVTTCIDLLRGPITIDNATVDDYILVKSSGMPVYHLAAMVDDYLMEITHVLRGSEWLPTFPLHVMIYQALEWQQPQWVHLSIFLNPSGKGKLSKRRTTNQRTSAKAIYALELRQMGYLPEAVVNWISLMGWSYDDHTEFFQMKDLIDKFTLEKLNPSPAAVNYSKLDHFNGLHIRALSTEDLTERLYPFFVNADVQCDPGLLAEITPLIQERIRSLEEAVEMAAFFFNPTVDPDPQELVGKNLTPAESATATRQALAVLRNLVSFEPEHTEAELRKLADTLGLSAGQLFGILRVAITGQRVSPPLIESMSIIGTETVLSRLEQAVEKLDGIADPE